MIKIVKTLPHIVLFKRSSAQEIIEKDINRWLQISQPERITYSVLENLVWLLKTYPEFRNLFYYRLGPYASISGRLLLTLAKTLYKPVASLQFFSMPAIGPGLFIRYGFLTMIGAKEIGKNCWINPGVTIGYKDDGSGAPTIGHNVYVGTGAKILGPVTIGDNAVIGANAVVVKNVPANCTVVGVPAYIIKRDGKKVKEALPALVS